MKKEISYIDMAAKTSITFGESMNTDFLSMSDCQCADSFHLVVIINKVRFTCFHYEKA